MLNLRNTLSAGAAVFLLALFSNDAQAGGHHGNGAAAAGACSAHPVDGGCAGSIATDSFINTGFATNAFQSGQSTIQGSHPQPNYMAGVDFKVGYDTTLVLKDPSTNPPAGYTYTGGANPNISTGTFGNSVVSGYELCPGGVPVEIIIGFNQTTAFTNLITNNHMCNSATQIGGISVGGGGLITVTHNQFDDIGATSSGGFFLSDLRSPGAGADVDIEYNALLNVGGSRVYGGPRGGCSRTLKYNYIYGVDMTNLAHGEIELYGGQTGQCTPLNPIDLDYNTVVIPTMTTPIGINAVFLLGTGAESATSMTTVNLIGNTVVTNKVQGTASSGNGLFNTDWNGGTWTIKNNYFDPTGSFTCGHAGELAQTSIASTSGHTLTITSTNLTNNVFEPGNMITNDLAGFTPAIVLPFGTTDPNTGNPSTGTGGVGTYVFAGSAQNFSSQGNWFVVPSFTGTPDLSGNVNLTDGSPIAFAGSQFIPPLCNNHA